jgi:hypothetical protein
MFRALTGHHQEVRCIYVVNGTFKTAVSGAGWSGTDASSHLRTTICHMNTPYLLLSGNCEQTVLWKDGPHHPSHRIPNHTTTQSPLRQCYGRTDRTILAIGYQTTRPHSFHSDSAMGGRTAPCESPDTKPHDHKLWLTMQCKNS